MIEIGQVLGVATALVIIPVVFLAQLATTREKNAFHWLLRAAYTGAYLAAIWLIGPWPWVSYHLRWVWIGAYAAALVTSYQRHRGVPFRVQGGARTWTDGFVLVIFVAMGVYAATGLTIDEAAVQLEFPLRDGTYFIGQGGNSPLINYHNTHPSQKYALDIIAVDAWGRRATGMYPAELRRYVIYEKPLYSPCDGRVTRAVDGFADLVPPDSDPDNPPGNHVVIHCHGVNVVLAHMRQGSVHVREGNVVATGQLIGAVGNSGNTTEPHLHIHVVRAESDDAISGVGVPIVFRERFLVRGNVVRN